MYSSFGKAIWKHAKRLLLRIAVPVILHSQAAVEYSLQSSASTPADHSGEQFRVGVCHFNARFFSCVTSYYPGPTLLIIALCPLVLWIMSRRQRMR